MSFVIYIIYNRKSVVVCGVVVVEKFIVAHHHHHVNVLAGWHVQTKVQREERVSFVFLI